MVARLAFSLFVLTAVTAFAPAPLPRANRERGGLDEISLAAFQGTWRVVSMERTTGAGQSEPYNWEITHIRVQEDRWTFIQKGDIPNASYRLAIGAEKPASLDFFYPPDKANSPGSMMGIIRRRGDRIDIVYMSWAPGTKPRPSSFESPPAGWFLLKLERQR